MRGGSEKRIRSIVLIFLTVLSTVTVDQISKSWALDNLSSGAQSVLIPGLLNLTLTYNTGVAFSIGRGHGNAMGLMAALLTAVIVVWAARRVTSDSPPLLVEQIGIGLILGGAFGNLVDRLIAGRVTDFLSFAFITFPVFNVADALIDVGIGLVCIGTILLWRAESQDLSRSKTSEGVDTGAGSQTGMVTDE